MFAAVHIVAAFFPWLRFSFDRLMLSFSKKTFCFVSFLFSVMVVEDDEGPFGVQVLFRIDLHFTYSTIGVNLDV